MLAKLPSILHPKHAYALLRFGKDYDGGYLLNPFDVEQSGALISCGISDDWSFEADFVNLNDVPVWAYDASISKQTFKKRAIKSIFRLLNKPSVFFGRVAKYKSYTSFFSGKCTHVAKFIGRKADQDFVDLATAIRNTKLNQNTKLFFKIDIEGSEFEILDDLLAFAPVTTGLVIEFHNCDLKMAEIIRFVEAYDLDLIHTHINTASQIGDGGLPSLVELSFTSSEKGRVLQPEPIVFPHELDQPNFPDHQNFGIIFSN